MDEATKQRAFEPFFSTKGLGSGTAIVNQLNGRIQIESTPGHGSTFRVLLPLAEPETAPPAPSAPPCTTTSEM
jgi:signal transduction histidine kinase